MAHAEVNNLAWAFFFSYFLWYSVIKQSLCFSSDTKIKNYERVSMVVGDIFDKYVFLFWGNSCAGG